MSTTPTEIAAEVILMADDDEDDRLLALDAIEASGGDYACFTVNNGQELLDYLRCEGKYSSRDRTIVPRVILLDLNMPILDGRETLRQLKSDAMLSSIPVVILSTSAESEDVNSSYAEGASSYMIKPTEFSTMVSMMNSFNNYWFSCATVPEPGSGWIE